MARAALALSCGVEVQSAATLARAVEVAAFWPAWLVVFRNHVFPFTPHAALFGPQGFGPLETSLLRCRRLEGSLAGTVALGDREGPAVGRKDDLHPGLQAQISIAGPQLNLGTIEGAITIKDKAEARLLVRHDLPHQIGKPTLTFVLFVAFPKLDFGAIGKIVTVNDQAILQIGMHADPILLVHEEVLPYALEALVAFPQVHLHPILDAVPITGQAKVGQACPR